MDNRIQNILFFMAAAIVLSVAILPVFSSDILGTADGLAHKFRLVSFTKSLQEGHLRPRWLGDQALGLGSPVFLLNYSLPYYLMSLLVLIGIGIQTSSQLYTAFVLIISGIGMFFLGRRVYGIFPGLVAATVYLLAPYHLLSVYLYDAWGEMTAFIFPPFILFFAGVGKRNYFAQTFLWSCLFLSHNVSALLFSPVILILTVLLEKSSPKNLIRIVLPFLTSILVTAFFWLPALFFSKETLYPSLIAREAAMRGSYFKSLSTLVENSIGTIQKGSVYYMDFTTGLPILIALCSAFFYMIFLLAKNYGVGMKKKAVQTSSLVLPSVVLTLLLLSLFLANYSSQWVWNGLSFLSAIVYPYRFLFPATFAGAFLSAFLAKKNAVLGGVLLVFAIISGRPFTNPSIDHFPYDDRYFYQIQTIYYAPGTLKNMATTEFLPRWVNPDFLKKEEENYQKTSTLPAKIDVGKNGRVISEEHRQESIDAQLALSSDTSVLVRTFFFPNWQASVDTIPVAVSKDTDGAMVVEVPKGNHHLSLFFGTSQVEMIGYIISFFGICFLIATLLQY